MLKLLLVIPFLFTILVGCSETEENPGVAKYESVDKLVPSGQMSQKQKDTWHMYKVSMASVDEHLLSDCAFADDENCDTRRKYTMAPDMNRCEFIIEETTADDGMTNERKVSLTNGACPVTVDFLSKQKYELEDENIRINQSERMQIDFKSTSGWPPGFNISRVNVESSVKATASETATNARGGFVYTITPKKSDVVVKMIIGMKISSGGYNSSTPINIEVAAFVGGTNLNFGAHYSQVDGVETYRINRRVVTKSQFDEIFGDIEFGSGSISGLL